MGVLELLDRLDGVRKTGRDTWLAKCPAHADRSPSLSIRENNGYLLLHDFGGCPVNKIMESIGLSVSDLFPARIRSNSPQDRREAREWARHSGVTAAIRTLDRETTVVQAAAGVMLKGGRLSPEDVQRLTLAAARIGSARSVLAAGGDETRDLAMLDKASPRSRG